MAGGISTIFDTISGGLLGALATKLNTKGEAGSAVHQANSYINERMAALNTVYASMGEGFLRVDEVRGKESGLKDGKPEDIGEVLGIKKEVSEVIKKELTALKGGEAKATDKDDKNLRRLANLSKNFISKDRYIIDKMDLFNDLSKSGVFFKLPSEVRDALTPGPMEKMGYEILTAQDTNLSLAINLTKMQNTIQGGIFIINGTNFLEDQLYTSEVINREIKDAGTTFDKSAVLSFIKSVDPEMEKKFDKNFETLFMEKSTFVAGLSDAEKVEVRKTLQEKGLSKKTFAEVTQVLGTESVSGLTGGYGHDVAYTNYMGYFGGETFFTTQAQMLGKWVTKMYKDHGTRTLKAFEAGDNSDKNPETDYAQNEIPILKHDTITKNSEDGKSHRVPSHFYGAQEYILSDEINANLKDIYGIQYDAYLMKKEGKVPEMTLRDVAIFELIEKPTEAHHNLNSARDFSKTATLMVDALQIALASGHMSLPQSLRNLKPTYISETREKDGNKKDNYLKGTVENPADFSNEHLARFTYGIAEAMANVKGAALYDRSLAEGKVEVATRYMGKEDKPKFNSRRQAPIVVEEANDNKDPETLKPQWRQQYKYLALRAENIVEEPQNALRQTTKGITSNIVNKTIKTAEKPFKASDKSFWGKMSNRMHTKIKDMEIAEIQGEPAKPDSGNPQAEQTANTNQQTQDNSQAGKAENTEQHDQDNSQAEGTEQAADKKAAEKDVNKKPGFGFKAKKLLMKGATALWDNPGKTTLLAGGAIATTVFFGPVVLAGAAITAAAGYVGTKYATILPGTKGYEAGEKFHGSPFVKGMGAIAGGIVGAGLTISTVFGFGKATLEHAEGGVETYGTETLANFKAQKWEVRELDKTSLVVDGTSIGTEALYLNGEMVKPEIGDSIRIPNKTKVFTETVNDTTFAVGFESPPNTKIELDRGVKTITADIYVPWVGTAHIPTPKKKENYSFESMVEESRNAGTDVQK